MKRSILLLLTVGFLILSGCTNNSVEKPEGNKDEVPDNNQEETPVLNDLYYNSFGFSSSIITDRSKVTDGYYTVNNEIEFLDALLFEDVKVIEITEDLYLGSKEIENKLSEEKQLVYYRNVYREHSHQPLLHPTLVESGIGLVKIIQKEDLMIFSKTGITIRHAAFSIDGSCNIVFRNLCFSELWEWDEIGSGKYDRNDWDYFTVEKSNGIWFDHLTFEQAYDGIIDVKEGSSNLTLSHSKLNFTPNEFIDHQIDYLENNQNANPYYLSFRSSGVSTTDLMKMASYQKKGFNLGNTTNGDGFEGITFTFHDLEIFNLQDRMPRLRKGDVHVYHIILDNTAIHELNIKLNLNLVNQGIVTTEGGAVLMENSIFKEVAVPIKSHQDSNSDVSYTGKYKVLDSSLFKNGKEIFGTSETKIPIWYSSNTHQRIPFSFRNFLEIPYKYKLKDISELAEIFTIYPNGHQIVEDLNWLEIKTKLHEKGESL